MHRDQGDSGPVDEFDRIVAGWRRERSVPSWPDDVDDAAGPEPRTEPRTGPRSEPRTGPRTEPPTQPQPVVPESPDPAAVDDDHFTPPEPPPLPPVGPPALVGLGLLALGLVLITVPWWIGVPDAYGLPLGLVTLACGLGWLVLRLWPDPPTGGDGGGDDGAVI